MDMTKRLYFILTLLLFVECTKIDRGSNPNIIYILTDDLGYGDIGVYGATDIKTPNIDYLAKNGVLFTDFYSASSVCTPSRAGLLTGRYPQRMGVNGVFFPESFQGMPADEFTIAEMLKEKNYKTGLIGKWHLGHHQSFLPLSQGFDEYFGIPYSNDMESVVYMRGNKVFSHTVDQTQLTKTYTQEAIDFIDRAKEQPFFLFFSHNMPHVPLYASDDFLGSSDRGLYGDVVQEIDWSVGQIIQKLKDDDLLNNTLIVFSSDNGPWLVMEDHSGSSGGLREGKMYSFDGGMKVPLIAMWASYIPSNIRVVEMANQLDWFPTIAEITGFKIPKYLLVDGVSIAKVLNNTEKREAEGFLFLEYEELTGFRKGDWKVKRPSKSFEGTWWKNASSGHDSLLFNLKNDPFEIDNLFDANKEFARKLFNEMEKEYSNLGELPPSINLRTPADESHLEYLNSKYSP